MIPSYLEVEKLVISYFAPEKQSQLIGERNKQIAAIWTQQNVVQNSQEQVKRFLHVFKVRKTVSQQLGVRKKCFPAIQKWKILVPSYFEPEKHCRSYLEREKNGFLLFGDYKMQFTTVRSKSKDYDMYLKSEKLVHSKQQFEK